MLNFSPLRESAFEIFFVRAKTFTELWLYIVLGIRYAFDADIINRLIIWQLGRGRQRTNEKSLPAPRSLLPLFTVRQNTK